MTARIQCIREGEFLSGAYHRTVIHSQESLQERIFGAAIPLGAPIPGGLDEVMNQQLAYELPVAQTTELAGPVIARS